MNPNISFTMRANFAKVLISLHMDRDPIEQINVPILTRVWGEIIQAKTAIPSSRIKIDKRLLKLKDFVINYFVSMKGV